MKKFIFFVKKLASNRNGRFLIVLLLLVLFIIVAGFGLIVRRCSSETVADVDVSTSMDGTRRLESIMLTERSKMLYGLSEDEFDITTGDVDRGETFSKLMNGKFNLAMNTVNQLVAKSKGVFDLRDMRAGNRYTAFLSPDSTQTLQYLVYDKNQTEFVLFDCGANPSVKSVKRDVTTVERYAEGVINSSLSATIADQNLPVELSNRLDNIFKWTIDFFALQKGDSFRVIYEELVIDTTRIGVSKIYGAEFTHGGKKYMAVSFEQDSEKGYWDQDGVNLRKAFLRSPLSFQARISSKFGMRVHPIRRVRSQHNGVDYACPAGTPVHAVANGTVIFKGWDGGGGGNMLKVQHEQGLASGYLHLRGFAKGIGKGSRVTQGDVIGYVGSTGMSTGPHLDFRIWKSGKPVDPTKMQSLPSVPIKAGNKASFNAMKTDVIKVMEEYKSLGGN